jgi:hypothetical protein
MSIPSNFPYDLINFLVKLAYHFSMGKKKITAVFYCCQGYRRRSRHWRALPMAIYRLGQAFRPVLL